MYDVSDSASAHTVPLIQVLVALLVNTKTLAPWLNTRNANSFMSSTKSYDRFFDISSDRHVRMVTKSPNAHPLQWKLTLTQDVYPTQTTPLIVQHKGREILNLAKSYIFFVVCAVGGMIFSPTCQSGRTMSNCAYFTLSYSILTPAPCLPIADNGSSCASLILSLENSDFIFLCVLSSSGG